MEFTANFDGSFGLWVEGFEVGWPAIHPNQDTARWLFVRREASGAGFSQLQEVREATASESRDTQLEPMTSEHDSILVSEFRRVEHRPEDIFDQFSAIIVGFSEFAG